MAQEAEGRVANRFVALLGRGGNGGQRLPAAQGTEDVQQFALQLHGSSRKGSGQLLGAALPVGHPLRGLLQGLGNGGCLVARRAVRSLPISWGSSRELDRPAQGGQGGGADLRIRIVGRVPQGGGRRREVPPPGQFDEDHPGRAACAGQSLGDEAVDRRALQTVDHPQGRLRNGRIVFQGRVQQSGALTDSSIFFRARRA